MADKKISELDAITTLADADVLVAVQGGVTKKVAASVVKTHANTRTTVLSTEPDVVSGAAKVVLNNGREITLTELKIALAALP